MSSWRKVSVASWKPRGDSSVYAFEQVQVDQALEYCRESKINFYAFCMKALAKAVEMNPNINATVRRNRIYLREFVSVFFHVVNPKSTDDLTGFVIKEPQTLGISNLNQRFEEEIATIKKGVTQHDSSKRITARTPHFLVRPLLNLYARVAYVWNVNPRIFKMPKDAFGSVMLTAVGSLGASAALCPIAPYTHVPMVVSIGKIEERPVVESGEVVVRKMVTFGFTFDHRLNDGIHFTKLFKNFDECFANPSLLT